MIRVTVIEEKYRFNKPSVMSEAEYSHFKKILSINPNYSIAPRFPFWKEFPLMKWGLIISFLSIFLLYITDKEGFGILFFFSFVFLLFCIISGQLSSMINYYHFLREKNLYYEQVKNVINYSETYEEFKKKMMQQKNI